MIYIILLLLYFISRSYTEAHKWGSPLSSSAYHIWRFIETVSPVTMIVYIFGWKGVGMSLVFLFIYERILCYRLNKKWFKEEGWVFEIGFKIPRYRWQDYCILICGLGIWLFV